MSKTRVVISPQVVTIFDDRHNIITHLNPEDLTIDIQVAHDEYQTVDLQALSSIIQGTSSCPQN